MTSGHILVSHFVVKTLIIKLVQRIVSYHIIHIGGKVIDNSIVKN